MENVVEKLPGQHLREILFQRMENNSSYSLRAFARDLGVSHNYLSQIINGRRGLSIQHASKIASALKFSDEQRQRLFESVAKMKLNQTDLIKKSTRRSTDESLVLEIDHFKVVGEWFHGAIMELTKVSDFRPSYAWIGKKLGIPAQEAKKAVARLERLGLLSRDGKKWRLVPKHVYFPTHRAELAIRHYHERTIDKAKDNLRSAMQADYDCRDITGITCAIDPKRIPAAKKRIASFRRQLMKFLSGGEVSDIYQLNIQLFSLSNNISGGRNRAQ